MLSKFKIVVLGFYDTKYFKLRPLFLFMKFEEIKISKLHFEEGGQNAI